ncbi:MAG TPA: DUF2007 domain-containing protein [Candidatus Enterocola sp.]|jgi:hypothetical protein|nr:MAG: hypothetical protein BWY47_00372 [Bacteroidetes bacterium ADurb.Bin302]HOH96509.1 DUF2007 domain-containing protein [Candidatus Enterocola sp.]
MSDADRTIVIKNYDNLALAHYEKSVIEDAGIDCFISGDNMAQPFTMFAPIGGIKLHIYEKDAEKALEILNSLGK